MRSQRDDKIGTALSEEETDSEMPGTKSWDWVRVCTGFGLTVSNASYPADKVSWWVSGQCTQWGWATNQSDSEQYPYCRTGGWSNHIKWFYCNYTADGATDPSFSQLAFFLKKCCAGTLLWLQYEFPSLSLFSTLPMQMPEKRDTRHIITFQTWSFDSIGKISFFSTIRQVVNSPPRHDEQHTPPRLSATQQDSPGCLHGESFSQSHFRAAIRMDTKLLAWIVTGAAISLQGQTAFRRPVHPRRSPSLVCNLNRW